MIYFLDFKASYTIYMIQNESRVSKLCSWSFKTMWGDNYPTLLETQNFMTPCYFGAPKEVSKLLTKSKYFSNFLTTIITNVLRTPKPNKIRVLKPFCRLLVALSKNLKTLLNVSIPIFLALKLVHHKINTLHLNLNTFFH